jgi:hypothetical protein
MYCAGLSRSSSSKIVPREGAMLAVFSGTADRDAGTVKEVPHEAQFPRRPAMDPGNPYCAPQPGHETVVSCCLAEAILDMSAVPLLIR